ncbi:sensor histidine kinase [Spongiactinospora sp. 9N601]|uniref:sensor histidine kinase n=1 Tax=Spongiactinospora sp. 9N601 TaxID=3375149 RepID=UPI0037B2F621
MDEERSPIERRWRPGHWLAVDVAVAVLLFGVGLAWPALLDGRFAVAAVIFAVWLPVAARRLWPWPVLGVVLAAAAVGALMKVGETYLASALALYTVASLESRRRAVVGLVAALAVMVLHGVGWPTWEEAALPVAFAWLLGGFSWSLGVAAREQRGRAALRARRAVAEERLRIARDLHDSVAHSMSLITTRAAIANHLAESRPDETRRALTLIEETGHAALAEMRHLLGVLRVGPEADGPEERAPGGDPAPGLGAIAGLVAAARAGGAEVEAHLDEELTVSDGVGMAVYRIVQESLTNVMKHAGPVRCRVEVARGDPGEVVVTVADEGGPALPASPGRGGGGHGLAGMRERAALYGGTLSAGPRPGGGFLVEARLPAWPRDAPPPSAQTEESGRGASGGPR